MNAHPITGISPLDGRYAQATEPLREIFSEYGLIKLRVHVEIEWLIALADSDEIPQLARFSPEVSARLRQIVSEFAPEEAMAVKEIERTTNHDVKAVEYYVKRRISEFPELDQAREFVHFGCTSYDINDNCFALMLAQARSDILAPRLNDLIERLKLMAAEYADVSMLSRTHGQPASTTTVGKELRIFAHRLEIQRRRLEAVEIYGKFNGAVGNFNALHAAYPDVEWPEFARRFVESRLGLQYAALTTQIEPHDYIAEYCHALQRVNSVLLDLCRDAWGYVSLGYFRQKTVDGEVGSSTMPHKVNPIDFENAEGNIGIANATLAHLAEKLPVSRWQRDLSDSTALRNLGVGVGHSLLAYRSAMHGLSKLDLDIDRLNEDLEAAWEILSEPVQTMMRKHGADVPYEQLKELTRGAQVTKETMREFIDGLDLPADDKNRLLDMTPGDYAGFAARLARLDDPSE